MKSMHSPTGLVSILPVASLTILVLSACTVVGPAAVHKGRLAYNEAIIETDNQQMLLFAVRNRYGERSHLLAVSSVTANVSVIANTGIEVGVGDDDSYAGNLVPFQAGVLYEENPTISYTPVGGEGHLQGLLSPVSVAMVALLTRSLVDPAPVYYALVSSVNGIANPAFVSGKAKPDARFIRLMTMVAELTRAHRLHWVEAPHQEGSFSIVINRYAPEYTSEVDELLALVGVSAPEDPSAPVILPVSLALEGRADGGIGITTRSVFDLLEMLTAAVEVPEPDLKSGVVTSYPRLGLAGKQLRVHHARSKPANASVAVSYRDGWYYIDDTDQATKQFFRLLSTLMAVNIAESSGGTAAPFLTVPVSR